MSRASPVRELALALLLSAAPSGAGETARWMSRLDGGLPLQQLSIPGTHQSAARREPFPGTARCQNLDLTHQLTAGIRFFDLRCQPRDEGLAIHHGPVFQGLFLRDVLRTFLSFLDDHPGECLIVSIKPVRPDGDDSSFEGRIRSLLAAQPDRWWLHEHLPTLGEARGRLVLLRRFHAHTPLGLQAIHWRNNTSFQTGVLQVQDVYRVRDPDAKWNAIRHALEAANADTNAEALHINFTSGYRPGILGLPSIPAVTREIHPRLRAWLREHPHARTGCLLLDFADESLVRQILQTQLPARPVP